MSERVPEAPDPRWRRKAVGRGQPTARRMEQQAGHWPPAEPLHCRWRGCILLQVPRLFVLSWPVPASHSSLLALPCGSVFGDSKGWACSTGRGGSAWQHRTREGNGIQTTGNGPVNRWFFPLNSFDTETAEKNSFIFMKFFQVVLCPGCVWVSCLDL